jgi:hypothetical protein
VQPVWALVPSFTQLFDYHVRGSRREDPKEVPILLPSLKPTFRAEDGMRATFFILP